MKEDTFSKPNSFTEDDIRRLIFQHLDDPPDLIDLQRSIIQWAVELLEANAGEIFLWDPARQALVLTLPTGYTQRYSDRFQGVELKTGEGLAGRAFQSVEPMIVADYHEWEGRSPIFLQGDEFGLQSVLAVPMVWQGKPIGVLTLNAAQDKKVFDESDIRLASLFSNIAAVSIMNARLYALLQIQTREIQNALQQEVAARTEELQQHNKQLNLSVQVSREITSIFELETLLNQVVNRVSSAFGYYCVLVFLTDDAQQTLILKAASGDVGQNVLARGIQVQIDCSSLNGQAAETHRLVIVNDVDIARNFKKEEQLPLTQSELVIPLQVGEQVLGTLDVQSTDLNSFSHQEVLILQSLADQVAIAIQNSKFYERSKELAVLEERNRLARELHDSVTQSLFSMDLHARAISTYMDKDLQKAREQILQLRQTTHDTLQEMRSLIYDLRPISLKDSGLKQAMQKQVERYHSSLLECLLLWDCPQSFSDTIESGLFRIAQEALRNAVKHAAATKIQVSIKCVADQLILVVEDNGRGFDLKNSTGKRESFGILGMHERAELLNGVLQIETTVGKGTRVILKIPV
jgi:signal transduction histidine kinase